MNRSAATTIVLLIAAWAIGALEGSVVYRRHDAESPVRFAPGLYQLERIDHGEPKYWIEFDADWQVRYLADPVTP